MLPITETRAVAHPKRLLICAALSLALAACGGGGGSPGVVGGGTTPTNPGGPGGPVTPQPVPTATVTMTKPDGTALTTLSGVATGTVRAVFKTAAGVAIPNAIVKFSVSDALIKFTPESASALTDANGEAVITITPTSATSAGAVAITASATVDSKAVSGTINLAVGPGLVAFEPTVDVKVTNEAGAPITSLSGVQKAVLRSVIKDSSGAVAANAIVQYTVSSPLLKFTPQSGSTLSDANGVAQITVEPASISAAGAVSITATAVVAGKTATATTNLSVSAATLAVSSIGFVPAPTGPLPAESKASLNIGVSAGGAPADVATGLVLSSLCVNDGAATLTPGTLANGVLSAVYVNKGCSRGTDVITATIGTSSMSTNVGVDPASIGTIQFSGSDTGTTALVLRGSGGTGRKESTILSYRVLDERNAGLPGVTVNFAPSTSTGGLTVLPTSGVSDSTGLVTTTVTSGTIPTPVRVLAQATRNGKIITGLSDTVIISTGLPIQKAMSLSVSSYNFKGADQDGLTTDVTVRLADQYGNPISDGTAVNLVTEGGSIGTPDVGGCQTKDGGCTVKLTSQNFRPANGRVTVLAYVQGIEDFVDLNGDGQYSCTNFTAPDGSVPAVYRPLIDTCVSGGEPFTDMGDPFLDAGIITSTQGLQDKGIYSGLDGVYQAANGDLPFPFNRSAYSATGNGKWGLNYIRATTEITFSDDEPYLKRLFCDKNQCRDWTAADGPEGVIAKATPLTSCTAPREFTFRLPDVNNNPLPHKTVLAVVDPVKVKASVPSPDKVPSTSVIGGTVHTVEIEPPADCASGGTGSFGLTVTVITADGPQKFTYKIGVN